MTIVQEKELEALQLAISNTARALYCVYLRPQATNMYSTLIYNDVIKLLNTKADEYTHGRQINALIDELIQVDLVRLNNNQNIQKSLNGESLFLPLIKANNTIETVNFSSSYNMTVTWRPETGIFEQICQLVGLVDKGYTADELGEYIAYWLGYPEKRFTDYQWTQKFVLQIKQRRQRYPIHKEQTKVGYQWVNPQANIEIDDNVKRLVEKYSENK